MNRHPIVYLELDEADPGLDVDAGVPHSGVQPEVLDLAEEAEQRHHLILGGLGRYVGHLDHPGVRLHSADKYWALGITCEYL